MATKYGAWTPQGMDVFGAGSGQSFGSKVAPGINEQLAQKAQEFGAGISAQFDAANQSFQTFRDQGGQALNDAITGIPDAIGKAVAPELESAQKFADATGLSKVPGAVEEAGKAVSGAAGAVADVASKVPEVLPTVADAVKELGPLYLTSKLTNSAIASSQGTAGQSVGKVAAPVIQAAQIATNPVAQVLKHPAHK